MSKKQRRYQHERQPLLPMTDVAKEINKRDRLREAQLPIQLELLKPSQQDLFG